MRVSRIMHFNNSEYLMFKDSERLADFHNCQYMGYDLIGVVDIIVNMR